MVQGKQNPLHSNCARDADSARFHPFSPVSVLRKRRGGFIQAITEPPGLFAGLSEVVYIRFPVARFQPWRPSLNLPSDAGPLHRCADIIDLFLPKVKGEMDCIQNFSLAFPRENGYTSFCRMCDEDWVLCDSLM